jgi:hypothetical protein
VGEAKAELAVKRRRLVTVEMVSFMMCFLRRSTPLVLKVWLTDVLVVLDCSCVVQDSGGCVRQSATKDEL